MANEPKKRHSKTGRPAVTIDLDPSDIRQVEDDEAGDAGAPIVSDGAGEGEAGARAGEDESVSEPATTREETDAATASIDQSAMPGREESVENETTTQARSSEPHAARPSKRSALAAAVGGGIIGAAVALAGAATLQWNGMLSVPHSDIAGLRQEVEDLKNNLPQQPATNDDTRAAIVSAQEAANSALSRADAANAAAAQIKDDLGAVQKSVKALQSKAPPVDSAVLKALDGRIANIEHKLANLSNAPQVGPDLKNSVDQLSSRLDAIGSKLNASAAKADAAASSAAGNAKAIASLESDVAGLKKKLVASAEQPKIARAIAATALKSAVDSGAPFATELRTYASVAPKSPELDVLKPFAQNGVATVGALQAQFPLVADRIIAATTPVNKNAGFFGQLLDSAKALVKVRPVGVVSGNGPDAAVARMGVALKTGDVGQALKEWESLPEAARKASQDFANSLRARRDADRAVAAALAEAINPGNSAGQSQ